MDESVSNARNDDSTTLPILDWEIAERRIYIPVDLQRVIGAPTNIIRVPASVHEKETVGKHAYFVHLYTNLSNMLDDWKYWCDEPTQRKWRIVNEVMDLSGKIIPILTVIGRDRNDSFNLVSMHRRDESYIRRFRTKVLFIEEFDSGFCPPRCRRGLPQAQEALLLPQKPLSTPLYRSCQIPNGYG